MRPKFQIGLICALIVGCASNISLQNASTAYKNTKDFQSLETIYNYLSKQTSRKEAEHLLGMPDYSPHEGLHYYGSTHSKYSIVQNQDVIYGLIVDYRDKNGVVTATLQDFWLGPISE